ncbi:hypothetical protein A0257_17885 [Hymenobacter psoromatis]|nr:hypothetical protein A0257_17885 [Hymenobacter psoromatis]
MEQLPAILRHILNQPGLLTIKHSLRSLQTMLDYGGFQRIKQLAATLHLEQLLERQPRFTHKYLSRYTAASFSRRERLAAILNHYDFLMATVGTDFFGLVASKPILWQEQRGADTFTIVLSYPALVGFEGELSLSLRVNEVYTQVVSFVIVPGQLVGAGGGQALLFSQVQGTHLPILYKHATKTLLDITPAALLVHAAYGLAAALGVQYAVGVSTAEQLSQGAGNCFDYDAFWAQLGGERMANQLFLLSIPPPEKPLGSLKPNHRARTLRKRQYKLALRRAVELACQVSFCLPAMNACLEIVH